jgi:SnoaL-like domain
VALIQEDRREITELLSLYGLLLDRQRVDEWMALFADDAVFEIQGQPPLTTASERAELGRTAPPGTHLAAPPVIREGGQAGIALSEQTFMFRDVQSGRMLAGWYEDVLVNFEGTWRFQYRSIRFHRPPRDST